MIAYLIWGVMLGLCFFSKKNKLISFVLLAYMILVIGLNTYSNDYNEYLFMYNNIDSGIFVGYEPGYNMLNHICLKIGLSFTAFRCVVSIIGITIISFATRRLSNNPNLLLTVFILYPVIGYTSGIRSLIPFAITLLGISFLVREEEKATLKYLICLSIAVIFHYSFIVYLLILFSKELLNYEKKIAAFIAELCVIICWNLGVLYNIGAKIIHNQKVLNWLNPLYYKRPSLVAAVVILFILYLILFWVDHTLRVRSLPIQIKNTKSSVQLNMDAIRGIVSMNMYFIPLLLLNMNYERFLIIPFAIGFSAISNVECFSEKKMQLMITLLFFAMLLCITVNNIIHNNIYFSVLPKNVIFEYLGI